MSTNPVAIPRSRLDPAARLKADAEYRWRNSGAPIVRAAHKVVAAFPWIPPAHTTSTVGPLVVRYRGIKVGTKYTLDFIEQQLADQTGHQPVRRHGPDGASGASDLSITGRIGVRGSSSSHHSAVTMPMRVHFVVDFNEPTNAVLNRISKSERRNHRQRLRRHDWTLKIARSDAAFDTFYDRMYRPTMQIRHGSNERVESKAVSHENLFRRGVLFILSMDGKEVAGHLCHWDPKNQILTSRLIGVLDGSRELYREGAIKEMHFLLTEWAGNNGVKRLDYQGTEPFLSKPTFQFKRLFGTRVIRPPNHFGDKVIRLEGLVDTPLLRDFLVHNPMVTIANDGSLECLYLFDQTRPARDELRGDSPGISGVRHMDLDDFFS